MIVTGVVAIGVSSTSVVDLGDVAAFLLYFVRRGQYSVDDILSVHGRYGLFNTRVVIFLVGIAVEIPFMNASWPKFEGPVASPFGGADISWLVGFVVAGVAYYFANRANGANGPVPETPAVPRGFSEAPVPVGATLATHVAPS